MSNVGFLDVSKKASCAVKLDVDAFCMIRARHTESACVTRDTSWGDMVYVGLRNMRTKSAIQVKIMYNKKTTTICLG
jgi:hypothetical protein